MKLKDLIDMLNSSPFYYLVEACVLCVLARVLFSFDCSIPCKIVCVIGLIDYGLFIWKLYKKNFGNDK